MDCNFDCASDQLIKKVKAQYGKTLYFTGITIKNPEVPAAGYLYSFRFVDLDIVADARLTQEITRANHHFGNLEVKHIEDGVVELTRDFNQIADYIDQVLLSMR